VIVCVVDTGMPNPDAMKFTLDTRLEAMFNAMNAAGLEIVRDFRIWIATLDGTKRVHDMTGVTAVQYKRAPKEDAHGNPLESPSDSVTSGHFDESIVYDDNWHRH
jgi:hypothetical protein